MSLPVRFGLRRGEGVPLVVPPRMPISPGRRFLFPGPWRGVRSSGDAAGRLAQSHLASGRIARPAPDDIRLSGSRSGDEPGWTDRRVGRWLYIFLTLGIALRL